MTRKILTAVAVMAIAPTAVNGQSTVITDDAVRMERAELLAEQAWIVANQTADFETAAIHLREAASLWGVEYASVDALVTAGRFQFYGKRPISAVSTLRAAAETAERIGDLGTAARAWREAAWVAAEVGELSTAATLLERAEAVLSNVAVVALGTATDS